MPAKNSIKTYIENGIYHIYNRGVEKRNIFEDDQDYGVFSSYLKNYLSPKDTGFLQQSLSSNLSTWKEKDGILKLIKLNNFYGNIKLLAYCLMPNHFHLLIQQRKFNAMDQFINSINTRYVMYFNKKYERVGHLFQGVYKAVLVEDDNQLLHLSAYIHRNPLKLNKSIQIKNNYIKQLTCQPSSLPDYLGLTNTTWLDTKQIISSLKSAYNMSSYEKFIIGYKDTSILTDNITIDK